MTAARESRSAVYSNRHDERDEEESMDSGLGGTAFETFNSVATNLANPPLQRWKQRGGKVMGFFCTMVPEELFMAAGLLPYRMRAVGSTGTDLADSHFTNLNCSFPRHCLNLALEGEFAFVDGLVYANSCDHIRRLYDNWKRQVPMDYIDFLSLPHQSGPDQITWYAQEFHNLRGRLEQHFDVEIKDENLRQAIRLANETRGLQRSLYEHRKADTPPITGTETLVVMLAGTAMPKEEYNELLRELLDQLATRQRSSTHRARVMVTGGILDDLDWIRAVEEIGALVVTDGTCFGTRIMWEDIDQEANDPLEALARYYLAERPSCPRLFDTQVKRTRFTTKMFRDFNCDGIIAEKLMFCDQWDVETYLLDLDLKEEGIPFLKLEREYISSGTGQLKTRVQAFIESMGK
jgi:bzd-type benzoyl-CoA reductase N subunit